MNNKYNKFEQLTMYIKKQYIKTYIKNNLFSLNRENMTDSSNINSDNDNIQIDDDDLFNNEKYKIIKEKIKQEIDENGNQITIIVKLVEKNTKYYTNLKKAIDSYRQRNREELNKKSADRRKDKYNNDPEYKEKIKEKSRLYYLNKKSKKEEL